MRFALEGLLPQDMLSASAPIRLVFSAQLVCVSVIGLFLICSLFIGEVFRRLQRDSNQFLNATGSMPGWVTAVSFLACNCGALEVIGLSGIASRYGVQAFHFYWIGAVPAMIVTGLILIPLYVKSGVRSVPEYLGLRFGAPVRALHGWVVLGSSALFAGLCLYSIAEVMHIAANWSLAASASIFACVVLTYLLRGGFLATVYNEIFQFCVMLAGLGPLLYLTRDRRSDAVELIGQRWHLWQATPLVSRDSSVDLVGVVIGLGVVISFSYWCTDFVLMQRALSARTLEAARRTPILAGFGKLLFSMIVVGPVVWMGGHLQHGTAGALDATSPLLMIQLYGPKLYSLGIAALVAGLVNGFASNVAAFSAVWTQEIYRVSICPNATEEQSVVVGRWSYVVCVVLSLAGAVATFGFEGLSDFTLVIFSMSLVPFFAILFVGLVTRRGFTDSAIWGVLCGILGCGLFQIAARQHWMRVGTALNIDFRSAILCFFVTSVICAAPRGRQIEAAANMALKPQSIAKVSRTLWLLSSLLAIACLALNLIWW